MGSRLDQRGGAEVGMRVGLVRMDSDGRPDVGVALGGADHVVPLALAGRDVEETVHAARARIGEHFVLTLGKTLVVEVAMAVDQPHAAASSSSGQLQPREQGVGCAIGAPPFPLSIATRSFSADSGITGAIVCVELPNRLDQRAKHRRHPLGIGLAQRPGRLRVDIGVAGEHRPHPGLDARRESEALERARARRVPAASTRASKSRSSGASPGGGKDAVQILEDHRQSALGEIAEAVGEIGIDAVDDRLGAVAAVLPEGDFAQQEIAQRIDAEAFGQRHRVDDIADALRHLLAAR